MSILLYERFAPPLVRRLLDDRQTVELAAVFLRVRVLATPLMLVSFFTAYLFQALSKGENIHDAGRGALAGIPTSPCCTYSTPLLACTTRLVSCLRRRVVGCYVSTGLSEIPPAHAPRVISKPGCLLGEWR